MAVFCDRLIDGLPLDIYGGGEQTRDHVYADGMATANLIAADIPLDAGLDGRASNVGAGEATSVNSPAIPLDAIGGARGGRVRKDRTCWRASPRRVFDRAEPCDERAVGEIPLCQLG